MTIPDDDEAGAVLAANEAFYAAFEKGDLDDLAATWEHSERVVCTHPGWPILRGWPTVRESWSRILGGSRLQFILTNVSVAIEGDVAWVTLEENLLNGGQTGGAVAALNLLVRGERGWLVVAHHGSGIVGRV